MRVSLNDIRIEVLKIIVLLTPLHVLIFNLIDFQPLTLWRDILILLLVSGFFFRRIYLDRYALLVIVRTIICVLFACFFHDSTMSASIWVNVLRVYLVPGLVIVILSQTKMTKSQVLKYCRLYVCEAFFISIFGIFQMFVIGRSYLQLIGVGQGSVLLADGTQRNISVFESANVLAIYLVFAIILIIQIEGLFKTNRSKWTVLLGILAGLVLTYSMSALLVLSIMSFIKVSNADYSHIKTKSALRTIILIFIAFFASIVVIGSNPAILFVLQRQLGEKITDIISTLMGTNSVSTTSAAIHYADFLEGFQLLAKNLNGLGFAKESFMVSDKILDRTLIGLRESSYLTIMYDFGVLVGIVYIIPYLFPIFSKKSKADGAAREIIKYFMITVMVSYLFLPIIQSYELTFFTFFFIGLFYYSPQAVNT